MRWRVKSSKVLSDEEADALFETAKRYPKDIYLSIVLAYNGAFRISEVLHLRGRDFFFRQSKINVIPLKKRIGKGKSPDREPPGIDCDIPENVMEAVREYIEENEIGPDDYLFPSKKGKIKCHVKWCDGLHAHRCRFHDGFRSILTELGIYQRGRGIHSMRHKRLSDVARVHRDPYVVQEVARHDSLEMSAQYVHILDMPERVRKVGSRL